MSHTIRVSGADDIGGRLRQMMDRVARMGQADEGAGWSPSVDIYETAEAVVLVAEVAGVPRQEVKVLVDGPVVRIYGHRQPTCCEPGARFHRMEIESGGFVRSFRIGVPFSPDQVRAKFQDGLLYVILPKDPDRMP
jgi:HSP20 family protein